MTARRIVMLGVMAILGLLLGATAAGAGQTAPVRYVNLGDSYSGGAGILPFAPGAPPRCTQSAANWAHDLARDRGYQLVDVSCSGAATEDFATAQAADVPPQLDAVTPDTQLVTMTIGGNDANVYVDSYGTCAQLGLVSAGRGNPCEQKFGNQFVNTVENTTFPNLISALHAVRDRAPRARIAISGYLQILPPTQGCFPVAPFAVGDVPYLNRVEAAFNSAVKRAAARTGATYLDVAALSAGHDACQPPGVRWVEPLIPINAAPAHPNARGEKAMADNAITILGLAPGRVFSP